MFFIIYRKLFYLKTTNGKGHVENILNMTMEMTEFSRAEIIVF